MQTTSKLVSFHGSTEKEKELADLLQEAIEIESQQDDIFYLTMQTRTYEGLEGLDPEIAVVAPQAYNIRTINSLSITPQGRAMDITFQRWLPHEHAILMSIGAQLYKIISSHKVE